MLATPLDSTTLTSAAYDPASQVLSLRFRSSAVYCYFDVPTVVYYDLLAAESKGSFFNRNIRRQFRHQKLAT
jgi:KTSC domain